MKKTLLLLTSIILLISCSQKSNNEIWTEDNTTIEANNSNENKISIDDIENLQEENDIAKISFAGAWTITNGNNENNTIYVQLKNKAQKTYTCYLLSSEGKELKSYTSKLEGNSLKANNFTLKFMTNGSINWVENNLNYSPLS